MWSAPYRRCADCAPGDTTTTTTTIHAQRWQAWRTSSSHLRMQILMLFFTPHVDKPSRVSRRHPLRTPPTANSTLYLSSSKDGRRTNVSGPLALEAPLPPSTARHDANLAADRLKRLYSHRCRHFRAPKVGHAIFAKADNPLQQCPPGRCPARCQVIQREGAPLAPTISGDTEAR
jgi:hypothetical protein